MYNNESTKPKICFQKRLKKVKSFARLARFQDIRSIYKNMLYFYKAVMNTLKL